jgi:hypothetical protein
LRAARVAAIAAIAATLISVGGVVWESYESSKTLHEVATTAAGAAVSAVEVHLTGETERSRAEFLRGQRQTLYAAVIKQDDRYSSAEELLEGVIMRPPEPRAPTDYIDAMSRLSQADDDLESSGAAMQIIASGSAVEAFTALDHAHSEYSQVLQDINRLKIQNKCYKPTCPEVKPRWGAAVIARDNARLRLIRAFREDMGAR